MRPVHTTEHTPEYRHLRTEDERRGAYDGHQLDKRTEVFYCIRCRYIARDVVYEREKP
jgi:hypothetical protein